jgi:hypothetical protein
MTSHNGLHTKQFLAGSRSGADGASPTQAILVRDPECLAKSHTEAAASRKDRPSTTRSQGARWRPWAVSLPVDDDGVQVAMFEIER